MTAPWFELDWFGDHEALVFALVIGIAFGWALERAGLGSARRLMGQFLLTDLAVFKVLFSALATAMLGAFWLSWLGVLDLTRVYVPETYWLPQLAGGLIFGVGLAVAGLCPGTSCVAAASGRGDGAAVVAGMFVGTLATGFAFPAFAEFAASGARGPWILPDLFGVPYGVVVAAVVTLALGGFHLAERLEQRE